jgi:hypothetical protein
MYCCYYGAMFIPLHILTAVSVLFLFVLILLAWRSRESRPRDLTGPPPARALAGDDAGDVRALLARGDKIEAIKLVREKTGIGLKEAKDLVERMAGEV